LLGVVGLVAGGWLYYSNYRDNVQRAQLEAEVARREAEVQAELARIKAEWEAMHPDDAVVGDQAAGGDSQEVVVDDPHGQLLWASPTQGGPISLAYVPAGAQCLVHLRPAMLTANGEGEKALAALGPWGRDAAAQFESLAGAPLAQMDSVLASIVGARDGKFEVCLRIEFLESIEPAALNAAPEGWSRFAAPGENGARRMVTICPTPLAAELEASAGDSPQLARDLEDLVACSDRDRVATVIVSPKFFAAGGAEVVAGDADPLPAALDRLVGREATAVALSMHWDRNFFVELRAAPALNVPPQYLATVIEQRVEAAADQLGGMIAEQSWSDYGRPVVEQFPAMVGKLAQYTRSGVGDRQAVVRAYLPAVAGHNLVMGAELLLTQDAAAMAGDADHAPRGLGRATPGENGVAGAGTIEERLAATASLVFPRESLERALELWGEAAGVAVAIDGPAFQAAGVTRNQSLELSERDRPAVEILVEILRRANPDRTATGPGDPRQVLVYVVEPDAAGGPGRMIVTTRAAAAERGAPLPAVFAVGGE
jgi:hypothetical protein